VHNDFEERQRRVFGQVDDGLTGEVPSSRSAQPTNAFQIRVVADSPEDHQAK
jgi:hypothetical protein